MAGDPRGGCRALGLSTLSPWELWGLQLPTWLRKSPPCSEGEGWKTSTPKQQTHTDIQSIKMTSKLK